MRLSRWLGMLLMCAVPGCGSDQGFEVVPVTGVVTLDDQPLAEADVTAIPTHTTPGLGGAARTNEQGQFQLFHARGERGLPPGDYKLTVSLRKRKDGSVPPVNDPTPPIESDAVETLPPMFSDPTASTLTATIVTEVKPLDIKLKSSK
ncbi:MAG: carboxypeptidase-like regulatory domain-containing protein [Planctomycetaceae bacterium]|nr:carboxypeptidase-like regulatory domain-containing protein [Planctomycetaceae bacterium]